MIHHTQFSWNQTMLLRKECFRKYGNLLDLPIKSPEDVLYQILQSKSHVLDVGAGTHKPFEKFVTAHGARYYSLDTDPDGEFHFRSFGEIPIEREFDLVIANQVIEHLTVKSAFETIQSAFEKLKLGGKIVVTVPNAAHPSRQRDFTHLTAWPVNDLYALLRQCGFEILAIYRYNKTPLTRNPLKRWIVNVVCREFRVDWCDSTMAVACKNQ